MKKLIFIYGLLFTMTFGAISQNVTDAKGLKQGLWNEEASGTVSSGYYKNGKKEGAWTVSKSNLVTNVTNYIDGVKNGIELILDSRGYIASEKWYKNDLLDGKSMTFRYGKVMSSVTYEKGLEVGLKTLYYENGKLQEESNWKNGIKDGFTKWYDDKGVLIAEYDYKDGDIVGTAKGYHSNGNLATESVYINGQRAGYHKEYYETGVLKTTGTYKNDQKTGEWNYYDEQGTKIKSEKL